MRKKRKKNNSKKIIIVAVILVICLSLTIYLISAKKTKEDEPVDLPQRYYDTLNELKDEYINDELEIVPDWYTSWARIYEENGTGNDGKMYEMLYMIAFRQVKNIQDKLEENATESKIREYYLKNQAEIEEDTGIDNAQEFIELAKLISEKKPVEYKNATFDWDCYEYNKEYTTAGINLEYSNTTLQLKVQVANKEENGKTKIKILKR